MLSERTSLFSRSGTSAARVAAKAAADAGKEIIDLCAGEIWADLSPQIREGAIAAITGGANRYTDTVGIPELREALAIKLAAETGQQWSADEIAITTGAKQALFNAAMVLLNQGDEVIIPSPYWATFPAQVLMAGGRPVYVDTRHSSFMPKIEKIKAAVTERTRAIVVNTPCNPTGVVYDRDTLVAITDLAIRHDFWIIFDECYGTFVSKLYAHHRIVSLVPEARSRTLIVNSFSKSLALSGWRIGYLAAPSAIIVAVKAMQSHTTSNPNVIAQHAVLEHLRRGDEGYERRLQGQVAEGRMAGLEILAALQNVPLPPAQGGFYFYLDLTSLLRRQRPVGAKSADDVANALLAEAGVATVAGTAFGDPMGLRLSYGVPIDQLSIGLRRVTDTLNSWALD